MADRACIAVIGAGIAGLTAADFLHRHGQQVVLFEAGRQIAGMAKSYTDKDGFSYDFGAHFITNRLAAAIGVGSKCRDVRYYGESVRLDGRTYQYPFGLMRNPRFLWSGIASRLSPPEPLHSAADWFRRQYGESLASRVALPLLEAWSGAPAQELAPAVGGKLKNGMAYTAYLRFTAWRKKRAVAIGYSHEMPENPSVWHVYPDGGVGTLCERLAENIADLIEMESPVEEIVVESGHVRAVIVKGKEIEVSAVVSTAPCHILAKMVMGTAAVKPLAAFRYRPMVFVNLLLNRRGILPNTVLWIPDRNYPFFRLTETTLSMPWLAPEGKTIITADIGCEIGDKVWSMSDEQLGQYCFEGLQDLFPNVRQQYIGCRVLRTPIAYPVFLNAYEQDRLKFERGTGVEGLWSIGRNGEFAHMLMEDVYWRTLQKMRDLMTWLEGCKYEGPK